MKITSGDRGIQKIRICFASTQNFETRLLKQDDSRGKKAEEVMVSIATSTLYKLKPLCKQSTVWLWQLGKSCPISLVAKLIGGGNVQIFLSPLLSEESID
eukprot:TRINITY_DN8225_c0_g1_i5.p2 TRINITY_DN8225_c0_g1~~TRINITY_DN8225_c0_g1_i5.p2  ORF type:complete len:100 (-),score=12.83 TRINITY_DN8225_c0_g1_i5:47-346(-)